MQYPFIHLRSQSSYSLSEGALKIEKLAIFKTHSIHLYKQINFY